MAELIRPSLAEVSNPAYLRSQQAARKLGELRQVDDRETRNDASILALYPRGSGLLAIYGETHDRLGGITVSLPLIPLFEDNWLEVASLTRDNRGLASPATEQLTISQVIPAEGILKEQREELYRLKPGSPKLWQGDDQPITDIERIELGILETTGYLDYAEAYMNGIVNK